MNQDPVTTTVEVYTHHHIYQGLLENRGHRLADLLNTATTNIVELQEVSIRLPGNERSEPAQCERLQIRKDQIIMARPTGEYEAPMRRVFCYTDKPKYSAWVVLPGYVLRGTIYMPERANSMFILREGGVLPSFVALTGVSVQPAGWAASPFQVPVMIFCRRFVEAAYVTSPVQQQPGHEGERHADADAETLEEIEKLIESLKSTLGQTFASSKTEEADRY
jgi:hypothetical protein